MYMNEENGRRRLCKYGKKNNEKHLFALESDRGGFSPRGFKEMVISCNWSIYKHLKLFEPYQLHIFQKDIVELILKDGRLCLVGLVPDSKDILTIIILKKMFLKMFIKKLELGASAITSIVYLVDKYGLPNSESIKK